MTVAVICLPATEQPALRRQELYTGFYLERERFPVDELICFAETPIVIGGLFVKRPIVQTATQSCLRQEMQQEASDEAIVVMRLL